MKRNRKNDNIILFFDPLIYRGNFFSNFSNHSIIYNKLKYPTVEHLFQALKFLGPDSTSVDHEYAEIIRAQNTPNKAKRLARQKGVGGGLSWQKELNKIVKKYQGKAKIRNDWDDVKDDFMYQIIKLKINQHDDVRNELIATQDKKIAENSPTDSYWGIGSDGQGENKLGKILMRVRSEVRV